MSAPTTQTENEIIMAASVAQAEEEEMSAATAQAAVAQAVDNDRDHPVCTLSDDQKAMVEANMEFIKSKVGLQDVGILLFRRIFQIAPEAIALFPKFSNVPPQDLEQNPDFKDHSLKVVETIELATTMLQEIDDLSDILTSLGSMHVAMGLQDAHFDVVGEALLWTVGQGLGDAFTTTEQESWSSFYAFVSGCMKKGLNEGYAAAASE